MYIVFMAPLKFNLRGEGGGLKMILPLESYTLILCALLSVSLILHQ